VQKLHCDCQIFVVLVLSCTCHKQAAQEELPGLEEDVAAGRFGGLKAWLNKKIHKSGSLYPSGDDLMIAATGSPLDPSIFMSYLTEKYSALYQLQ
jgi:carboxypeptidase Taq